MTKRTGRKRSNPKRGRKDEKKIPQASDVEHANVHRSLTPITKPNLILKMGEPEFAGFNLHFRVKKTLRNRFRYWMLCRFFPFKVVRWDMDGD